MNQKHPILSDISHLDDVKLLVDRFYESVRGDELLGPIFTEVIGNRWPKHLDTMYRFWQTLLLEEHSYHGAPFPPHAKLPIDRTHFERWLQLFYATVDRYFVGETADEAKWRADRMAQLFVHKLAYFRENGTAPLI